MKDWYKIENSATDNPEVLIYAPIGGGGFFSSNISAREFITDIKALKSNKLTIRINSPGGNIFDGIAIYNYLLNCGKDVTTIVDGAAVSIASIILLAGKTRKISAGGMVMIHNPAGGMDGESAELRKLAALLDQVKEQLLDIYEDSTGVNREELAEMMNSETWMSATEAEEKGFVTEIMNGVHAVACTQLGLFNYQNKPEVQTQNFAFQQITDLEDDVKEILNMLVAKDEAEGIAKIKAMMSENSELGNKVKEFAKTINSQRIEIDLANKKIAPSQKEFAEKMLNQGEELYNEWLKTNKPIVPGELINLADGQEEGLTFEELIKDPIKARALKESDPVTYEKIFNAYIGGK